MWFAASLAFSITTFPDILENRLIVLMPYLFLQISEKIVVLKLNVEPSHSYAELWEEDEG